MKETLRSQFNETEKVRLEAAAVADHAKLIEHHADMNLLQATKTV